MDLITAAGLLKTVTKMGDCYESLVREFIVNIPSDITNRKMSTRKCLSEENVLDSPLL